MKCTPQNTIVDASTRRPRGTGRASRRRGRRCPGSRAPGSCGRGSPRRARGERTHLPCPLSSTDLDTTSGYVRRNSASHAVGDGPVGRRRLRCCLEPVHRDWPADRRRARCGSGSARASRVGRAAEAAQPERVEPRRCDDRTRPATGRRPSLGEERALRRAAAGGQAVQAAAPAQPIVSCESSASNRQCGDRGGGAGMGGADVAHARTDVRDRPNGNAPRRCAATAAGRSACRATGHRSTGPDTLTAAATPRRAVDAPAR